MAQCAPYLQVSPVQVEHVEAPCEVELDVRGLVELSAHKQEEPVHIGGGEGLDNQGDVVEGDGLNHLPVLNGRG